MERTLTRKRQFPRCLGPSGQCGFTLLELMISVVMIAIIVVIVGGAMRLGFRSVEKGEKRIESLERSRMSFTILQAQLQSQVPLTYEQDGEKKYLFQGSRDTLQIATNYSIWSGERGYVSVSYRVEEGEGGKRALFATENIVGVEGTGDVKLFDGFDEIYFEYYYKDPTEEAGTWVDEWKEEMSIPEKVLVHLVRGAKDLALLVPIRVGGSPDAVQMQGLQKR
jgi:general secretion pathway protein J